MPRARSLLPLAATEVESGVSVGAPSSTISASITSPVLSKSSVTLPPNPGKGGEIPLSPAELVSPSGSVIPSASIASGVIVLLGGRIGSVTLHHYFRWLFFVATP